MNTITLEQALKRLLKDLHIQNAVLQQQAAAAWPDVVGPAIAAVTKVKNIIDGDLTVTVQSAAWREQLNILKHAIIEKLNRHVGGPAILRIFFE